jgi:FkbM family methyltransferase
MSILRKIINKVQTNKKLQLLRSRVKAHSSDIVFLSFRGKEGFYLPYASKYKIDRRQLFMVSRGLSSLLLAKYTSDEIKMKKTDTVIDCGAFVGGFTVAAAKCGVKKIYSIEPSTKNFKCLELNVARHNINEKVTLLNMGLGNEEGELKLNLSESGCDDSFLAPDEGDLNSFEKVRVTTLQKIIEDYSIDVSNLYLKVEAEGFEPEIVRGLGPLNPRVITVDVTPERDGLSPVKEIRAHLENKGYKIKETPRILFATYNYNDERV